MEVPSLLHHQRMAESVRQESSVLWAPISPPHVLQAITVRPVGCLLLRLTALKGKTGRFLNYMYFVFITFFYYFYNAH